MITREQIQALKLEAGAAGDKRQVRLCEKALELGEASAEWLACEWAIDDAACAKLVRTL